MLTYHRLNTDLRLTASLASVVFADQATITLYGAATPTTAINIPNLDVSYKILGIGKDGLTTIAEHAVATEAVELLTIAGSTKTITTTFPPVTAEGMCRLSIARALENAQFTNKKNNSNGCSRRF